MRKASPYSMTSYIDAWDLTVQESILGIIRLSKTLYPNWMIFNMSMEARTLSTQCYGKYSVEIDLRKPSTP
jgi:hypothetical protein